jgi:hypothetical protein
MALRSGRTEALRSSDRQHPDAGLATASSAKCSALWLCFHISHFTFHISHVLRWLLLALLPSRPRDLIQIISSPNAVASVRLDGAGCVAHLVVASCPTCCPPSTFRWLCTPFLPLSCLPASTLSFETALCPGFDFQLVAHSQLCPDK